MTFTEVSRLDVAANLPLEGLTIFEWSISLEAQGSFSSVIGLAQSGRLIVECRTIEIDGIEGWPTHEATPIP